MAIVAWYFLHSYLGRLRIFIYAQKLPCSFALMQHSPLPELVSNHIFCLSAKIMVVMKTLLCGGVSYRPPDRRSSLSLKYRSSVCVGRVCFL